MTITVGAGGFLLFLLRQYFPKTPPSCPNPTDLEVSYVSVNTANIYWMAGSDETQWEVSVQPAETGIPTGSGEETSDNSPYQATNLTQDTDYEVYVRGNCGNGDFQQLGLAPVYFSTLLPARVNFIQESFPLSGYDMTVVDMNGDHLDDIVNNCYQCQYSLSTEYWRVQRGKYNHSTSRLFCRDGSMAAADF